MDLKEMFEKAESVYLETCAICKRIELNLIICRELGGEDILIERYQQEYRKAEVLRDQAYDDLFDILIMLRPMEED